MNSKMNFILHANSNQLVEVLGMFHYEGFLGPIWTPQKNCHGD